MNVYFKSTLFSFSESSSPLFLNEKIKKNLLNMEEPLIITAVAFTKLCYVRPSAVHLFSICQFFHSPI
jgi:hypothetical protein